VVYLNPTYVQVGDKKRNKEDVVQQDHFVLKEVQNSVEEIILEHLGYLRRV
jgi:hypothetical protein